MPLSPQVVVEDRSLTDQIRDMSWEVGEITTRTIYLGINVSWAHSGSLAPASRAAPAENFRED